MAAKKRQTGYAARARRSGFTTSARNPREERRDHIKPPAGHRSIKLAISNGKTINFDTLAFFFL